MTLALHTVSSDSNHCLHLLAISAHLFPLLPSSLLLPIFVSRHLFIHYGHMLQLLHCFLFNFRDQNRMFCIIPQFLIISDSRCPLCQYWSIRLLYLIPDALCVSTGPYAFLKMFLSHVFNISSSFLIMNHGPHLYVRVVCNFFTFTDSSGLTYRL